MSKLHRLSIFNIPNVLSRGRLVREIQEAPLNWTRWEVKEGQSHRPDIIAYRFYGTVAAVPIVLAAGRVDNPEGSLPVGDKIALPSAAWIRQRILHYEKVGS